MSRYLGPIFKKSRRLGFSILENNKDLNLNKNERKKRFGKRKTEFGRQLEEKQKLRFRYHINEKQLRNIFVNVLKMEGDKKENLLKQVELRLDNFVYRAGFAPTRRASRQMVNHGHILLNNQKATIASMFVQVGDVIGLKKEKLKKNEKILEALKKREKLTYINVDESNFVAELLKEPLLNELKEDVDASLVIEYYNRFV